MSNISCPHCGQINEDRGVCRSCRPDGFRIEDDGAERRISWRWFSLGTLGALVFVSLWDGILAFVIYLVLSSKGAPLSALAVLAILGVLGVGMAYAVVAYLINRTVLHVDAATVSVRHGPLPWFGAKEIPKAEIAHVWSETIGRPSDEDTLFEPAVTYRVRLLLMSGPTLTLVSGLRAPEQAQFIEQRI
jgi:hypothetical protein